MDTPEQTINNCNYIRAISDIFYSKCKDKSNKTPFKVRTIEDDIVTSGMFLEYLSVCENNEKYFIEEIKTVLNKFKEYGISV